MTRNELVEMARKSGFEIGAVVRAIRAPSPLCEPELKRFAKLVAAAEREAVIDIVAMHGGSVEIEAAIRARSEK